MAQDFAEIWTALCDEIVGDAAILAMLGSAESVIYSEDKLAKLPDYPFVRLMLISARPERSDSGIGRWDLLLQIDVFGPVKSVNWQIQTRLQELLDIPRSRPAGLDTASFSVTEMAISAPLAPVGDIGIKDGQGREIKQLSSTWTLRVKPLT